MEKTNKMKLEELGLRKTTAEYLKNVPIEEIVKRTYAGTLDELKHISKSRAEEVTNILARTDAVRDDIEGVQNALHLYYTIVGLKEFNPLYEISPKMIPWLGKILDSELTDREARVIKSYFGVGKKQSTFKECSKEFGVSMERINQIINKAISKLKCPSVRKKLDEWIYGFYCDTGTLVDRVSALNDDLSEYDDKVQSIFMEACNKIYELKEEMNVNDKCKIRDALTNELNRRFKCASSDASSDYLDFFEQ